MATLYFYKGTAFPNTNYHLPCDKAMLLGKEQIVEGMRMSNLSIEEQSKDYFQQLDILERTIFKHSKGGLTTKKTLGKVAKELGQSIETLYAMWCVNICSLLVMKKLENDDMNGTITVCVAKR